MSGRRLLGHRVRPTGRSRPDRRADDRGHNGPSGPAAGRSSPRDRPRLPGRPDRDARRGAAGQAAEAPEGHRVEGPGRSEDRRDPDPSSAETGLREAYTNPRIHPSSSDLSPAAANSSTRRSSWSLVRSSWAKEVTWVSSLTWPSTLTSGKRLGQISAW